MPGPVPPTLGVILAGGLARRMGGGDKPLLRLGGRTLLDHVAERLGPQCSGLILNINGPPARFGEVRLPVVPDPLPGHPGPLAGILAALDWAAAHRPGIAWVVSAPGDTPFLPPDLVPRLHEARESAGLPLAAAASGGQLHPAVGLWPVDLRHDLREAVAAGGLRSVRDWANRHGMAQASWGSEPPDPFFNINTPEDLARAGAWVATFQGSFKEMPANVEAPARIDLDLSGLKCPLPVLRTRKALRALKSGDRLQVTCTDPLAAIDLPNLLRETGDTLEDRRQDEARLQFLIRKA
jgi:molybdopterin-guanine dinucleotide biosynthesis protein A